MHLVQCLRNFCNVTFEKFAFFFFFLVWLVLILFHPLKLDHQLVSSGCSSLLQAISAAMSLASFLNLLQATIMRRLKHPSVVSLVAVAQQPRLLLVMEFAPGRSLAYVLQSNASLSRVLQHKIILQVSEWGYFVCHIAGSFNTRSFCLQVSV